MCVRAWLAVCFKQLHSGEGDFAHGVSCPFILPSFGLRILRDQHARLTVPEPLSPRDHGSGTTQVYFPSSPSYGPSLYPPVYCSRLVFLHL